MNAGVPVVVVAVVVLLPVSHSRGDGGYSRTTDSDDRARVQNITKRDGGDLQKKNAFCTSRTHDDMYTRTCVSVEFHTRHVYTARASESINVWKRLSVCVDEKKINLGRIIATTCLFHTTPYIFTSYFPLNNTLVEIAPATHSCRYCVSRRAKIRR